MTKTTLTFNGVDLTAEVQVDITPYLDMGRRPVSALLLGTGPLDEPDLLSLIADEHTPLGKLRMDDFKAACRADAEAHGGWVHPSRVSKLLHDRFGEIDPRSFSAKWGPACGPKGFLDKTKTPAPIDPTHSKGNGNKDIRLRRWRGWDNDHPIERGPGTQSDAANPPGTTAGPPNQGGPAVLLPTERENG
jgi:hypothetical protein